MPPPKRIPILIDWRIRILFAVVGAFAFGFGVYTLRQFDHLLNTNPYYLTRAFAAAFLGAVCLIFAILPWNRMMAKSKDD
jgi:hypothetical protein